MRNAVFAQVVLVVLVIMGILIITGCGKAPVKENPCLGFWNMTGKEYKSNSSESCKAMRFVCDNGENAFFNECGCGCEVSPGMEKHECTTRTDACTLEEAPVCGWYDPAKLRCTKYPCAADFGNKCMACANTDVGYYTDGKCPQFA